MKKIICLFFITFLFNSTIFAQSETRSIVDEINTPKKGEGNVKVYQDESIQNVVAIFHAPDSTGVVERNSRVNFVKIRGYRIQVFSGNNQTQSKLEAEEKGEQIRSTFPELEVSITYDTPTWRLRAGNFLTRNEAEAVLKEMKRKFPSFGREMYIVSDAVKRPSY